MFNWRPQTHSGWQRSRSHGHILTPRNIFFDTTLVFVLALILFTMWKLAPARIMGFADLFRAPAPSAPVAAVPAGEHAVLPLASQLDVKTLLAMTDDRSANVRVGALTSLAEQGDLSALPRVQELQVVDGNDIVQQAAYTAEDRFRAHIATVLNLPVPDVKFIAATESGNAFAVTTDSLFGLSGGEWHRVSTLPDMPNGIAATPDAQTVYLATMSTGLWRSSDGGRTWNRIQFGLDTPTQLTVTAVTLNPEHTWQVFIALAGPGAAPDQKNPLGVFVSDDEGNSWHLLPDSPVNSVTTRLVIHLPWTGFLYGVADGTPWRYTLPLEAM